MYYIAIFLLIVGCYCVFQGVKSGNNVLSLFAAVLLVAAFGTSFITYIALTVMSSHV